MVLWNTKNNMEERVRISLKLIERRVMDRLSSGEEVVFQLWIEQSQDHQDFYQKAVRYFENDSRRKMTSEMRDKAWWRLEKRLEQLHIGNKRVALRRTLAAVVAACVVVVVAINFLLPFDEPSSVSEVVFNPGVERATLILDDGREVELDGNKEIEVGDERKVSVKGNVIQYESHAAKRKVEEYNTLKVSRGETFSLFLSDGTKVYLNSESKLRYPVEFIGDFRSVELVGEAFFEVKEDKAKPFIVTTQNQQIKVLGTAFNVAAFEGEAYIMTTLVEGSVTINEISKPEYSHLLIPNEQIVFSVEDGGFEKHTVNVMNYTSWKDGVFEFENMNLASIMSQLGRWYDFEHEFLNNNYREMCFTGGIKKSESLRTLLEMIEKTTDIHFTLKGEIILIEG
jgi:transmembrane sensor